MTDDLTIRQPDDRKKINVNQSHEVTRWAEKLGVTEDQLRAAVKEAGPMVDDVKLCLLFHSK